MLWGEGVRKRKKGGYSVAVVQWIDMEAEMSFSTIQPSKTSMIL